MSLFTAVVAPGKSVGFLLLGASLHDVLTRIKSESETFTKLDLIYSPTHPVTEPIILDLPSNGIRLRFDGPSQRLRLIEVLDFSKNRLSYKNQDIVKHSSSEQVDQGAAPPVGPPFKYIYQGSLFGTAYEGEYVPPNAKDTSGYGLYVLSYPGVAFTFPVLSSELSPGKDYVSLLSSPTTLPAVSMAVYIGESWTDVRGNLFTMTLPDPKTLLPGPRQKHEPYADEIGVVKILGGGHLELQRPWAASSFILKLGQTTPQDLVAELGPPDAIYRKHDQRMDIHKMRTESESRTRPNLDFRQQDDSTDTDQSSTHTITDDSEPENGTPKVPGECFYNYFYHGFDILISKPTPPSPAPPSSKTSLHDNSILSTNTTLVATKMVIHSNVPGSYSFNRHRRCRWEVSYLPSSKAINSESPFTDISTALTEEWEPNYSSPALAARGMVVNRGWGDSPSSSMEILGGPWEDSAGGRRDGVGTAVADGDKCLGNTTLFGFPGLVFDVLKNGTVSGLTVF